MVSGTGALRSMGMALVGLGAPAPEEWRWRVSVVVVAPAPEGRRMMRAVVASGSKERMILEG